MTRTRRVGVFVGSLRRESFTRKVANAIVTVAPPSLSFEFVDIGAVSHYNPDLESSPPADWVAFDSTREFLRTFTSAFAAWIELNLAGKK